MIRCGKTQHLPQRTQRHFQNWTKVNRNAKHTENTDTHKFDKETNNGVRRVIKCIGITGKGATCVSTYTNATPQIALATKRHHIRGCDQGSSSVDFKLNPRSRVPTVATSVVEPKTSILRSFSEVDRLCTSRGSFMSTFVITRIVESARIGICDSQGASVSALYFHRAFYRRSPVRGKLTACKVAQFQVQDYGNLFSIPSEGIV